jgi:hypothetical protein
MGLDVYATSNIITKLTEPIQFDFYETLGTIDFEYFTIGHDFAGHVGDYGVSGQRVEYMKGPSSNDIDFRAGSYSSYNSFRNHLSCALLGVTVSEAWENEETYSDHLIWDLLNFSDCEGVIGPTVSDVIHKGLVDNQSKFSSYLRSRSDVGKMDEEYYNQTYANFMDAFAFGKQEGIVIFA